MDGLRERQNNEVSIIESMFCNNYVDLRQTGESTAPTTAIATSTPTAVSHTGPIIKHKSKKDKDNTDSNCDYPFFRITLFPNKSESQYDKTFHVQIDLKLKLTANYPNE
jgi:hypothetical protein